ncbi:hypothetical protein B9Z55_005713 [Caenorhabditis nigoni]|uniref:C6 domain-containing protein n=1 Tax=Caenorhabditis nigoni TaxID=1611254 RepID=A0A2G5V205_9PELO|nr:hypothetical protein B9Z55_005713 [Caenorhabditis nigoni]
MISAVVLFLSAISVSNACVPTGTTTTTTRKLFERKNEKYINSLNLACCTMLSSNVLPRRAPSITTQQQCSVLQRVSSTCPIDGIVVCDAAQETNPSGILIQFFNAAGTVVRSATASGSPATSLSVRVVCVNGVWRVPTSSGSTTLADIASVSCSQNFYINRFRILGREENSLGRWSENHSFLRYMSKTCQKNQRRGCRLARIIHAP